MLPTFVIGLREGVAELVGVDVGFGSRVAHEVREESLDNPVLAHDTLGPRPPLAGQERLLVLAAPDQAVALEALEHLACGGA